MDGDWERALRLVPLIYRFPGHLAWLGISTRHPPLHHSFTLPTTHSNLHPTHPLILLLSNLALHRSSSSPCNLLHQDTLLEASDAQLPVRARIAPGIRVVDVRRRVGNTPVDAV